MNPLDTFQRRTPRKAKAFDGLITALKETNGLDAKTKQLVYIGIKSAMGDTTAIYYHVPMAQEIRSNPRRDQRRYTNHPDRMWIKRCVAYVFQPLWKYTIKLTEARNLIRKWQPPQRTCSGSDTVDIYKGDNAQIYYLVFKVLLSQH